MVHFELNEVLLVGMGTEDEFTERFAGRPPHGEGQPFELRQDLWANAIDLFVRRLDVDGERT